MTSSFLIQRRLLTCLTNYLLPDTADSTENVDKISYFKVALKIVLTVTTPGCTYVSAKLIFYLKGIPSVKPGTKWVLLILTKHIL